MASRPQRRKPENRKPERIDPVAKEADPGSVLEGLGDGTNGATQRRLQISPGSQSHSMHWYSRHDACKNGTPLVMSVVKLAFANSHNENEGDFSTLRERTSESTESISVSK